MLPDLLQEVGNSAEASKICEVPETSHALVEEGAEGRRGGADRAPNEIDPDETAVEPSRAGRNELEHLGQLLHETDAAGLAWREAGNETAEVDTGRQAERRCQVLAELPWVEHPIGIEGDLGAGLPNLRQTDLIAQGVDVLAELDVAHAILLECFQTGDLGDQVHHAIVAAHQLPEPKGRVGGREVLLPVGVREGWRAALDGRAEDIDPRRESHVEGFQVV